MAEPTLALLEYLRKAGVDMDVDFLREGIQLLTKLLMELGCPLGADPAGRSRALPAKRRSTNVPKRVSRTKLANQGR